MRCEPGRGGVDATGGGKTMIGRELEKDKGGGEGVGREAADGLARPGAIGLLEGGEVADAAIDGRAVAVRAHEGADAQSGSQRIAPAAVGLLGSEDGVEGGSTERRMGLAEFIEADDSDGAGGDWLCGESEEEAVGGFGSHLKAKAEDAAMLVVVEQTLELTKREHTAS